MSSAWEYKVITLARKGTWKFTETPEDPELNAMLNREGNQGWELVSAVQGNIGGPVTLYLKRPR